MTHYSQSPEETKNIAREFSSTLQGGEIVLLFGNLGSGKTTFVQGVAETLGVTKAVRSPTFTVMNIHATQHPTICYLIHLDFYRFESPEETRALGLEEMLGARDTVVFIEWPEKGQIPFRLPSSHRITFKFMSDQEREIVI